MASIAESRPAASPDRLGVSGSGSREPRTTSCSTLGAGIGSVRPARRAGRAAVANATKMCGSVGSVSSITLLPTQASRRHVSSVRFACERRCRPGATMVTSSAHIRICPTVERASRGRAPGRNGVMPDELFSDRVERLQTLPAETVAGDEGLGSSETPTSQLRTEMRLECSAFCGEMRASLRPFVARWRSA